MKKRAVLIAGPTASGKSGFAMALAKMVNGVIVNADSMQVYDGLRILTARPSEEDEKRVPHRLYGHVPAETRYSVGAWLRDVAPQLELIYKAGQIPIFVGGTGLYFRALTEGIAEMPTIREEDHNAFLKRTADTNSYVLHDQLSLQDSESASKIERGDRQRTLRALMVLEQTGQSLTDWQRSAQTKALLPLKETVHRVLMPSDREWLYERIKIRFHEMVEMGAPKEARDLLQRRLSERLPIMNAIGIPHYIQLLWERRYPVHEEVVGKSIRDTRRYAKRQMTWFRNQMGSWPRLDPMEWEQYSDKIQKDLDQIAQDLEKQG